MTDLEILLRDEIARALRDLIPDDAECATVESIDEDGAVKVMVIDEDANCFRVTVEQI